MVIKSVLECNLTRKERRESGDQGCDQGVLEVGAPIPPTIRRCRVPGRVACARVCAGRQQPPLCDYGIITYIAKWGLRDRVLVGHLISSRPRETCDKGDPYSACSKRAYTRHARGVHTARMAAPFVILSLSLARIQAGLALYAE